MWDEAIAFVEEIRNIKVGMLPSLGATGNKIHDFPHDFRIAGLLGLTRST